MAPKSTDDNLAFLYKCLQATPAKARIFAAATDLNVPAARMRFTRLKDKLEGGADLATTRASNATPGQKAPRQVPAIARDPPMRKARCVTRNGNEGQMATKQIGSRPLRRSQKLEKRQTRGKKLNYNLSDLQRYEDDDSDGSDLTESTSFDSDGDFCVDEPGPRSQVDSGLNFDSERETKPASKRVKKQPPVEVTGINGRQILNNRKHRMAVAKGIPPSKHQLSANQVPIIKRIPTSQKKGPVELILPLFDQPIPSIEASPPCSIASSYDQTGSESDSDITRLQPGTLLYFGSTGGAGLLGSPPSKGKHAHATSSPPVPSIVERTSQISASPDSAGVVLQIEPKNHVLDVTPDDSVSMANKNDLEERFNLRPSPKTPSSTTGEWFSCILFLEIRAFRSLMGPGKLIERF
ncbi:uncharacterized protein A1O9_08271 [Exophiala aquamarina CBS 119918]|uniref:Uncharacterized protein n=1 Tax=Exophiala aquamarina CBS 119918 TaxID=1182545 RepID=A0A072P6M7_9EURO|nr:uncharacterized protein A1O9_08271 [Exophiala aquamarina CBS 119918]KEF55521.1 hypothetical protein A1O9_08271 [Exophiala aquamarina CBS 119918]